MSSPPTPALDSEHESPGDSSFNTPISSPSGHHTPAAGYRAAAGTLSNVFASLWGTYNQQAQAQEQQQFQSGPSRLQPSSSSANTPADSPNPSVPAGWVNLLSWGPAAGRQKTTALPKSSASPSRGTAAKSGRARGAIPFNISAPLEAESGEKAEERLQRQGETSRGARLSPASSPPRRPLAGIFEDIAPASPPPQTPPPPRSPASPRSQFRHLPPPASPSLGDESPRGAYATLSRLQSKPSSNKLPSGSGFLWPSSSSTTPTSATGGDQPASPISHSRPAANWSEALARTEKLDCYVRRIVFQAGLDYETRPMVVFASCCLPDPKEVDYDALLDRIMDTMDLFVENDYTVIYFAAGGHHRPGWNWIWRAYRRLDRRFRKNLKKLYIVHPTFFTRSLLQFLTTGAYLVSPKFSKKVVQLYTLSALAGYVPLTQIDIPPEVLQWNLRYEKHVNLPQKALDAKAVGNQGGAGEKVFGVDLVELMGEYGESGGVPRVVRDCVEAILGDFDGIRPAEVEGIFRRSPSSALLKTAQESYDRGHPVSLEQYRDPHIPAVLLKVLLRSLPRPIFPASMYGLIRACPPPPLPGTGNSSEAVQAQAQETIHFLRTRLLPAIEPPCAGILLSYVLEMLHKVAQHKESNKMDAANLATVIAPNLVSSGNAIKDVMICRVEGISSMSSPASAQGQGQGRSPSMRKASISSTAQGTATTLGSILRFCIERYYEIFDDISFSPQINSVQELVDDLSRKDLGEEGSRSPSTSSKRLASLYGTPASASGLGFAAHHHPHHQRGESTNSSPSQSPSSFTHSGGWGVGEEEEDRRSGLTGGKSVASREGYRAPTGFQRTVGRNSSGSLRLTKGRLGGSNSNLRGSLTNGSGFRMSNLAPHPNSTGGEGANEAEVEGLTSQLSGVLLTGANATATFASPGAATVAGDGRGEEMDSPSSPILILQQQLAPSIGSPNAFRSTPPTAPQATVAPARRKSVGRELSEVAEAETEEATS
ncbi:related to Rho-GTPase-activating protein 1 [Ustilago sp. UG-2017a]|nr:related to Rho-GTPase-activating protein 1 [Ustilago sp. UG-2017a]